MQQENYQIMRNKILFIFILSIAFVSCNKNSDKKNGYTEATSLTSKKEHPGKKLLEINCNVCHSPTAGHDERIAPPMIAVKKHYLTEDISKEDFIKSIQVFMKNPNAEDSKMPGAVRRFGVMPKASYPESTITLIAEYLYEFDIEQPEWFEDHFQQGHENEAGKGKGNGKGMGKGKMKGKQQATKLDPNLSYEDIGMKYAMETKAELGKNLMMAIQKKGAIGAVEFCNENAYSITDSLALQYSASIKRVSDKPRNPKNAANSKEKYYLKKFEKVISNNQEPQPIVEELSNKVNFYYPITTNSMCLQCHGKTIDNNVYNTIKRLYQNDMAIGYAENEVRGMWSISFDKE